jgi:hypothetical protein
MDLSSIALLQCFEDNTALPGAAECRIANLLLDGEHRSYGNDPLEQEAATRIFGTVLLSNKSSDTLIAQLRSLVSIPRRTETLARRILGEIKAVIPVKNPQSGAMFELQQSVHDYQEYFINEHSALTGMYWTILGVGILAVALL